MMPEREVGVWKTACGLLINGTSNIGLGLSTGDCHYGGVCYSAETGNPLVRCPYPRKGCPHIPSGFPLPMCPCGPAECVYDYDRSLERIQENQDHNKRRAYMDVTGGRYCACVEANGVEIKVDYDVVQCIRHACQNDFCVVRKQPRDLRTVNIYYDVRRTWAGRTGLFADQRTKVTKGLKVFPKAVARTDAELWLQQNRDYGPLLNKHILQPIEDGVKAGPEDYSEFFYQVENIRIAHSDRRDIQQDAVESAAGIEVIHVVDEAKKQIDEKRKFRAEVRERRAARAMQKEPQETMDQITIF